MMNRRLVKPWIRLVLLGLFSIDYPYTKTEAGKVEFNSKDSC
jgi:hypothetical protein